MSGIRKEQEKNINRLNAYFVGKHGNDATNNGLSDDESFLTDDKAFSEILAQTPGATNQFALETVGGGIYDGTHDMTTLEYVKIHKPSAIIKTNDGTINSNCSIHVKEYLRDSGVGDVIIKEGAGRAYIKTEKLYNPIATGGCVFVDEGEVTVDTNEFTSNNRSDTLISFNPATTNKKAYIKNKNLIRGKIFTTATTDELYIDSTGYVDSDFYLNAASKTYINANNWNGNILSSGALAEVYLKYNRRISDPRNDVLDTNIILHKIAPQVTHEYTASGTVKLSQYGDIITNKGAVADILLLFPDVTAYNKGRTFTITCVANFNIICACNASQFIFVSATGVVTTNATLDLLGRGSAVQIQNDGDNGWTVTRLRGRTNP